MAAFTEFELIDKLLKPLAAKAPGAFGLTDDAAMLPELARGEAFVVTKDALSVGTHMLASDPPSDMARKSLRVNLSDLAAMGARPTGFFMALCLGQETEHAFLDAFISGLSDDVDELEVPLMGGDIIRQDGAFTVSITAFGAVQRDQVLRRNGARAGDSLWVSGTIGDGALGLKAARGEFLNLDETDREELTQRYRVPQPRMSLGAALAGVATACIDISDGLVADVGHICKASGVSCTIDAAAVPLSSAAQSALTLQPDEIKTIFTGGDDYELGFAIPPEHEDKMTEVADQAQTPVHRIGTFGIDAAVRVLDTQGKAISFTTTGYRHDRA